MAMAFRVGRQGDYLEPFVRILYEAGAPQEILKR